MEIGESVLADTERESDSQAQTEEGADGGIARDLARCALQLVAVFLFETFHVVSWLIG